jgi:hypothetical protein
MEELGRDFLIGLSTMVLGAAADKYGSAIKEFISKASTMFIVGKTVGEFQGILGDIAKGIQNLEVSEDRDINLNTIITDLRGVSGSADRFSTGEMDIDVGDLYETYAEEEEMNG